MKNSNIFSLFLIVLFTTGLFFSGIAQTDKEILAELAAEEQEAVNALVLYPEDTRMAILNAAQYPEALIKMESIQSQTSTSFKTLMQQYPQSTQEVIWDLTRYPDLIPRLIATENKSSAAVDNVLKDYPEAIHPRARQAVADHFQLLALVNEHNRMAESAFTSLLDQYPMQARKALQQLVALPEVLTILTDNIRLTVLVGDLYKNEPAWLLHKVDSLNLEVARQNAEELEDWKESLENDPEAMEELKASAEEFAEDYGYDDEEFEYESDDLYYDEPDRVVVNYHYNYHYPYWFGYPYWYEYPRWRYYPYWYDWGFYFGPMRTIIVVGLPSYHFTHWYFHHPFHHSYYPHLSARFTNHYYGHRTGTSSVTSSVSTWRNNNKGIVTDTWLKDDGKLSNRFKEYGKLEVEREKYNQKNPKKALSQKEYVTRNSKRYPEISKSVKESKNEKVIRKDTKPTVTDRKWPVNKDPKVTQPKTDKVSPRPKVQKPEVKKTVPEKPQVTRIVPKVNKARDYHKNTWEKSKTNQRRTTTPKVIMPKTRKAPKVPKRTKPKTKPRKPNG